MPPTADIQATIVLGRVNSVLVGLVIINTPGMLWCSMVHR